MAELLANVPHTLSPYIDLDGNNQSLDYREAAGGDPYPLPLPVDRENYGTIESTPRYWATGLCDWRNVQEACRRHGLNPSANLKWFDFGCATGRFLRQVDRETSPASEVWGCDFSPENIRWSQRHLSPRIRWFLNHEWPTLPIPDGYFDVVTAFSVFTHIDLFEEAWLLELIRITQPGGILYLTIQNEATWRTLPNRPNSIEHLMRSQEFTKTIDVQEEMFHQPLTHERLALVMRAESTYNRNVWHKNSYIQSHWGKFAQVLSIHDNGHNSYQSPVILRPNPRRHS